ncbi:MAG: arginine--tRNA ligase [Ruminococcaceae bacterium]|nr:arginine--tRNA ligase [Oscillospiraceae bacterium]
MVNLIKKVKEEIIKTVLSGFESACEKGLIDKVEACPVEIENTKEKKFGDFATNFALKMSKVAGKNPRELAGILLEEIGESSLIEKAEVAGPGFINFFLNKSWLYNNVMYILKAKENFGKVTVGNGKKVMVEFISANPTGPMHIGNARGGALGDSLANLLNFAGYSASKEFYVNDYGNQIEKFAVSLNARFIQKVFGEDAIEFPEDAYHGQDIIDNVCEFIEKYGCEKYKDMDETERKKHLVEFALNKNIEKLKADTGLYGITYDRWFFESELHKSGAVKKVIEELSERGYTYEKDEATWFKATEFGSEKDVVLIRGNNLPTYFAADIAYHKNKIERGYETLIDIWGADHHGHVARMQGALTALGLGGDKLTVILMQLVRLMKNGEVYKVSKRSGKAVTLTDLLEDIGTDAARFFFNLRQANTHFDFDMDLAVSKSNDNPVFYVQYAHARISSILSILSEEGVDVSDEAYDYLTLLKDDEELDLIEKISWFPQEVEDAALTLDPSKLTKYAVSVASSFHTFYNAKRVKVEDTKLMKARIMLIKAVKITLKNLMGILGITAPDRM